MDCSPPGSSVHGDCPGKNTGVDCHSLLQAIFPTWGIKPWPSPGIEPWSPVLQADPLPSELQESTCNMGDLGLIPGLGRSPGEGNSYPVQYSGLENSMDCIVHGVIKSWTQLSDFHFQEYPIFMFRSSQPWPWLILSQPKLVSHLCPLSCAKIWKDLFFWLYTFLEIWSQSWYLIFP